MGTRDYCCNKAGGLLVDGSFIACIGPSEDPNDSLPRRASEDRPVASCRLFVLLF